MEYNFRGKHDSTKNYVKKDVVSFQPNTSQPIKFYICLTDHTTPQIPNPNSDSNYWGVLNTSSNFPNSVDSFLYRANVQVTDQIDINRINELRTKPSLTVDEQNELNTLMTKHRNKLFLAEDINALQQSVSNMQLFFKDNIDAKLQDYNNQITQNKDDALTAIEKKKENIIEYMDGATAGQIRNDMGVMGELTTAAKDSLVNAINEVNAKEVDLTPIENSIGNKALLETDNKENLVNAINEVNSKPSIHIGTDAPTKGEFWLDDNEKLNYKNNTGVWKGVAPSQEEFDTHNEDNIKHLTPEEKTKLLGLFGNQLLEGNRYLFDHVDHGITDVDKLLDSGFYHIDSNLVGGTHPANIKGDFLYRVYRFKSNAFATESDIIQEALYSASYSSSPLRTFKRYLSFPDAYPNVGIGVGDWIETTQPINISDSSSIRIIYVDAVNGVDKYGNGTDTGTKAFKTIQYAVDSAKKINVGAVRIKLAQGSYNENVYVREFFGSTFEILGDNKNNTFVNKIESNNVNYLLLTNISTNNGFNILGKTNFVMSGCAKTVTVSGYDGVYISDSRGTISNCTFDKSNRALNVNNNSSIKLTNVSGTDNQVGISSDSSIVFRANVTLSGTVPTLNTNGGQIF